MRALIFRAAEAGYYQAWRLARCTPAEIRAELSALAARRRQRTQDMDLLAWLAGRYMLIGMHAPKRFPRRPDAIRRAPLRMTDSEMKQVFAAMAVERGNGNGDC